MQTVAVLRLLERLLGLLVVGFERGDSAVDDVGGKLLELFGGEENYLLRVESHCALVFGVHEIADAESRGESACGKNAVEVEGEADVSGDGTEDYGGGSYCAEDELAEVVVGGFHGGGVLVGGGRIVDDGVDGGDANADDSGGLIGRGGLEHATLDEVEIGALDESISAALSILCRRYLDICKILHNFAVALNLLLISLLISMQS